jgi:hypothetical protein
MNRKFLIYNLSAFLLAAIISLVVYWKKLFITVDFKVILILFSSFIVISNVSCLISSLISKSKWVVDFFISAVLYVVAFYIFGSFIETAEEGLNVFLAFVGFCVNILFFIILLVVKRFLPARIID